MQRLARWLVAALFVSAGCLHLANPEPFLRITPEWVPWPQHVVAATGLFEIVAALALLRAGWRRAASLALSAYCVAVFPANLKHALEGIEIAGLPSGWWYHGPRLALQPVIIGVTLYAGGWFEPRSLQSSYR